MGSCIRSILSEGKKKPQSMLPNILKTVVLLSVLVKAQDEDCCQVKEVGGITYQFVKKGNYHPNCTSDCIYEEVAAPGQHYCFAPGDLESSCSAEFDPCPTQFGPIGLNHLGDPFSDLKYAAHYGSITRIFVRSGFILDFIQVEYGFLAAPGHGGPNGIPTAIKVNETDCINAVNTTYGI